MVNWWWPKGSWRSPHNSPPSGTAVERTYMWCKFRNAPAITQTNARGLLMRWGSQPERGVLRDQLPSEL
ncbi:hypothetical protein GWI33_002493 [Rhynchophorus ferrugineus]|uniref:Uncharacterized protein n=1 Tax=Rhynchophorus ferrugineus TaxID=354439 RepID=A0A834MLK0_RHYFE|nr:hypothetical protein GWI33_002493 [Rhynchophorus ferrugineus]